MFWKEPCDFLRLTGKWRQCSELVALANCVEMGLLKYVYPSFIAQVYRICACQPSICDVVNLPYILNSRHLRVCSVVIFMLQCLAAILFNVAVYPCWRASTFLFSHTVCLCLVGPMCYHDFQPSLPH